MLMRLTLAVLSLASCLSPALADGLAPAGITAQGLCYASGTSGPRVPCVLQGQTWTRVLRPTDPIDGATVGGADISAILGSKAPLANPTFSGTVTAPAFSGGGSGLGVTARGSTRARLAADRAADTLNPLDFVPPDVSEADILSGAADAAPAFTAAINSRPAGARVTLVVPYGTYRLDSDVSENGREVHVDMSSGATAGTNYLGTLGPGRIGAHRVTYRVNGTIATETQGSATATNRAYAKADYVSNNRGESGAASFFSYGNFNLNNGTIENGGDISSFTLSRWYQMTGTGFATWDVGISPKDVPNDGFAAATGFSLVGKEINLVHNGPTGQWTEYDSSSVGADKGVPAWNSVGIQIIPDAWTGTGRKGGHNTVGFMVGADPFLNARTDGPGGQPYNNGTFSPFHIGNNAVAPGGRGMYFGGNTDGNAAKYAYAGIEVRHKWPMFLNLENAELTNGWIVNAIPGQSYRWSTPAGDVTIGATSAGKVSISAPGGVDLPATAWTAYTPSQTGAGSGAITTLGTVSGRYQVVGGRIDVSIIVPITTNGTGGAYVYTVLPVGLVPKTDCVLAGAEMANVTSRGLSGRVLAGTGTVAIFNSDSTYPGANGARLVINGSCELQ